MTTIEFNSQVTREASSLKMLANHFTHDDDDAKDLVQDTMLKAISYASKFNTGTNLKGWLYTIMKNTYLNNYRRIVRINKHVVKSDDITSANLLFSATGNAAVSKFVIDDIQKTLKKLPDSYAVPFNLYVEGFKYHEIAAQLKIPVGTVKTRIHVARISLKKQLKAYNKN